MKNTKRTLLILLPLLSLFCLWRTVHSAQSFDLNVTVGIYSASLEQVSEVSAGDKVYLALFFTSLGELDLPVHLLRDKEIILTYTLQGGIEHQESVLFDIQQSNLFTSYKAIPYTIPNNIDGESFTFIGSVSLPGLDTVNSMGHGAYRLSTSAPPLSQPYGEAKLVASDADLFDAFGWSVSISGDSAIVGAFGDGGTQYTGAAYIYEQDTSGNWKESSKLTASDAAENDYFGTAVSISGNYAIVGAYFDYTGTYTGAAYIYERDDGGWNEVSILTASDADEYSYFGISVSISDNSAIVGANWAGAAYIYERDESGNWNEVSKLTPQDSMWGGDFGTSVSISGNYAIVGAHEADNGTISDIGAAYIYERDSDGNWLDKGMLLASDAAENGHFGRSVSIYDHYAIVGCNGGEEPSPDGGAAYIFVRDSEGNWHEETKLTPSEGDKQDGFGADVAINDKYALVGAYHERGNGTGSGAAYLYTRQTACGSWRQVSMLSSSDAEEGDQLGYSVALSDNSAMAGAAYDDDAGLSSGAAYIFDIMPDDDGDGYSADSDCNDSDNTINPGVREICQDGIDQNCNGSVDETDCSSDPPILLALSSYSLFDGMDDKSSGNADGLTDAGETVEMQVTLKNTSHALAPGVTASLSTNDQYVTITDSLAEFGNIASGTSQCQRSLAFEVDAATEDGHLVNFTLEIQSRQKSWTEEFSIVVHSEIVGVKTFGASSKLMASDAGVKDYLGHSVSVSGNYAIAGAYGNDQKGKASGAAYIYKRDPESNWNEVTKLVASDAAPENHFGSAVFISGHTAIVGAYEAACCGTVYIYEREEDGDWREVAKLMGSDTVCDDYFGLDVAINGNFAIVGAAHYDWGYFNGSAYIFEKDTNGVWSEVTKLVSNAPFSDGFGVAVSISGNLALVGAPQSSEGGAMSGAAYIFERDSEGNWNQVNTFLPNNPIARAYFGQSVSMSGDSVIIGAYGDENFGITSGTAYIYERNTEGVWNNVAKLSPRDAADDNDFGSTVAIDGSYAIIGAPGIDEFGAAYLFSRQSSGDWIEKNKFTASYSSNGEVTPLFGTSVGISGSTAIVGAPEDGDDGLKSGAAYMYRFFDVSE